GRLMGERIAPDAEAAGLFGVTRRPGQRQPSSGLAERLGLRQLGGGLLDPAGEARIDLERGERPRVVRRDQRPALALRLGRAADAAARASSPPRPPAWPSRVIISSAAVHTAIHSAAAATPPAASICTRWLSTKARISPPWRT